MGRKRAMNPAKVKVAVSALEDQAPREVFQRRLELRRRLSVVLLNLLAIVLLTVSFAPFDCWYLAYVALVPWGMALSGGSRPRWALLCAWLAGLLFWAGNLYWLWWITLVGYAALVVYLSLYWLAAGGIVRQAMRRNMPMWLVLPAVWVSLEFARDYVISGFPWLFLAHTQYSRTALIQIADVTGHHGVSFFVAMVNGLLIDLLCSPLFVPTRKGPRMSWRTLTGLATTVLAAGGLLVYGAWRLGQSTQREGPIIGIVQQAYPISLSGRSETPEAIFNSHLQASQAFLGAQCDLVIWPETMLPGPGLNRELFSTGMLEHQDLDALRSLAEKFADPAAVRQLGKEELRYNLALWIGQGVKEPRTPPSAPQAATRSRQQGPPTLLSFAQQMANLSQALGCPVLAGGVVLSPDPDPNPASDVWVRKNGALLFDRGWRAEQTYCKVHLVPFSEAVPFKKSVPWLYRLLRSFVPECMPQLEGGDFYEPMRVTSRGKTWGMAIPICFEGTFARICRSLVMEDAGPFRIGRKKRAEIIANLSNDGWFVWRWGNGPYRGSTEHAQHLVQYCFRAVENRVPVVRAVNTGISASIDSNGRIVSEVRYQRQRAMVAGTLLLDGKKQNETEYAAGHGPKVLVDDRVSPYSVYGDMFAYAVCALALGIVLTLLARGPRKDAEVKP